MRQATETGSDRMKTIFQPGAGDEFGGEVGFLFGYHDVF
jgi:hypothetical protein